MKKILIAFWAICSAYGLHAQNEGHNLFINAGGGIHQLKYQLNNGTSKGGVGTILNAGYSYFFNNNWGVSAGIGLQTLKSEATLNYMVKSPDSDTDGDTYELRTNYKDWKEEQNAYTADIPIALNFKYDIDSHVGLTTSIGGKFSIPFRTTYKATGGTITTTGYYSQWNVEFSDLPEQRFTTYANRPTGDITLKPTFSFIADIGATFKISKAIALYTGAYTSYGIISMLKNNAKPIYQKDGTYNGILSSYQSNNLIPMTLGVKLGVVWNMIKPNHKR